ncbi:DUF5954 family protein [Streptomyces sp. CB02261]|uniref:DUF5954 family protein n=1 Tax=Streptomyces sp. CB02261 TaxID=1703940 RepID=UPI000A80268F|nr:DUF5954 family protein [Streptomyces sp. CB02261]
MLATRYRVVRAEEYAALDPAGDVEMPRPTDPESLTPVWNRGAGANSPRIDDGLLLDPGAPLSSSQAAERLSLRSLAYSGTRFPDMVLADSARAVETHPDVLLMPTAFLVVEWSGADEAWTPASGLLASGHDARQILDFTLTWWRPRHKGLIPYDAAMDTDARTLVARTDRPAPELALPVDAADRLRTGHVNQVQAAGTLYRIARSRRLLRPGPDGPEGPRPRPTSARTPLKPFTRASARTAPSTTTTPRATPPSDTDHHPRLLLRRDRARRTHAVPTVRAVSGVSPLRTASDLGRPERGAGRQQGWRPGCAPSSLWACFAVGLASLAATSAIAARQSGPSGPSRNFLNGPDGFATT